MINLESIKRIIKRGKMVLIPFGLVGATILTGCSAAKQEDKVIKSAEKLDLSINLIDNDLYDFDGYNIYKVNTYAEYSAFDNLYLISEHVTPEEFGEYVGEVNVTWEDVKTTIKEANFDDKLKNTLLKGANNLETILPNINLSILNYNLKNLRIVNERDDLDINVYEDYIVSGVFDEYEQIAFLPTELYDTPEFDSIAIHEIFGHGMQSGYCDEKYCSTGYTILASENRSLTNEYISENMSEVGHSLNEAVAEMIAVIGTGKKIQEKDVDEYDTPYDVYVEQLQLYLKTTNITLSDYVNKGLDYLLLQMKNAGCKNPLNYIIDFDCRKQLICEEATMYIDSLVSDMQSDYLYEIASKKLEDGEDRDTVIKFVNDTIDSVNYYVVPTLVDGQKGVVWSTPDCYEVVDFGELKQNVKVKIN